MWRLLFTLLLTVAFQINFAQNSIVFGKALSYRNKTLTLFKYADYITFTPENLDTCTVDTAGNFYFSFPLKDTELVLVNLETTYGLLYAAPNQKYHVLLPQYKPITIEQQLSPYFKPQLIRLYVLNHDTTSLNFNIARIDYYFAKIQKIIVTHSASNDSILKLIKNFQKLYTKNTFEKSYLSYQTALLYAQKDYNQLSSIAKKYLAHKPILWNNPAYFRFFNYALSKSFSPDSKFFNIKKIYPNIIKHNFDSISTYIQANFDSCPKELSQLIALKGLYDLFYSETYFDNDIIKTIQNSYNSLTDSNLHLIAKNIYRLITQMRLNYSPPNFKLRDKLGLKHSLKSFRGKFIYLNFCHPELLPCQEQLPMLQKYYPNHPKDFEIVSIIYGLTYKQFKHFVKTHKQYSWKFLYGGDDKQLLHKYKVVAFPTYYLISPDGKLLTNPAPSPLENFEQTFISLYKKWHLQHENTQKIR